MSACFSSSSSSSSSPPRPPRPQLRWSKLDVPCRTSTAMMWVQCSLPDLNRDHVSSVFLAGPQRRSCEFSVPCRTSTAIVWVQCSVPDLNRDHVRRYVRKNVRKSVRSMAGLCCHVWFLFIHICLTGVLLTWVAGKRWKAFSKKKRCVFQCFEMTWWGLFEVK